MVETLNSFLKKKRNFYYVSFFAIKKRNFKYFLEKYLKIKKSFRKNIFKKISKKELKPLKRLGNSSIIDKYLFEGLVCSQADTRVALMWEVATHPAALP